MLWMDTPSPTPTYPTPQPQPPSLSRAATAATLNDCDNCNDKVSLHLRIKCGFHHDHPSIIIPINHIIIINHQYIQQIQKLMN